MADAKRVLLVGWSPDAVDYSKWPGLTPEKLLAALEGDRDKLNDLGYQATLGFIKDAETAKSSVLALIDQQAFDCVLIGAGVRTVDDYFLLFEQLVNVVHAHAPAAKICFNTNPHDSVEAVQRWV